MLIAFGVWSLACSMGQGSTKDLWQILFSTRTLWSLKMAVSEGYGVSEAENWYTQCHVVLDEALGKLFEFLWNSLFREISSKNCGNWRIYIIMLYHKCRWQMPLTSDQNACIYARCECVVGSVCLREVLVWSLNNSDVVWGVWMSCGIDVYRCDWMYCAFIPAVWDQFE